MTRVGDDAGGLPVAPSDNPIATPDPWNAVARGHDEELSDRVAPFVDEAIATLPLSPSDALLDVATGPGTFALRAAPRVGRVVAIDFAQEMVARLRDRLDRETIPNVEALVMDGHAMDFEASVFDHVVSMFGWFLFADREVGLAEMRRVLRPGGTLLVTSWSTPERNTTLGIGLEAICAIVPDFPRPASTRVTQHPENCVAELEAAGFVDVQARLVQRTVRLSSAAAYFQVLDRASAPFAVLRERLGDGWPQVRERMRDYLGARLGPGEVALQAEAIFTSGRA